MWSPPSCRKTSYQQQYSPPSTYRQRVHSPEARRAKFGHQRSSSTFEESDHLPLIPGQFTQSDTGQLYGWQSKRPGITPHSVPNKPRVYKFGLHSRHGAFSTHAETVGAGLGAELQELESNGLPECGICLEEFSDEGVHIPLNLNCGHSYCTGCVKRLLLKSLESDPVVTCPKCSSVTHVKNRDVSTLTKNFGLIDVIHDSIKSTSHLSTSAPPHQSPSSYREREHSPVVMRCEEHNGDNLSSFCTKCGELVCSSCLLYGKHRDHNNKTMFVSEAANWYRQQFLKFSPDISHQQSRMEAALGEVERMNDGVQEMGGSLVLQAEQVYGELIGLIEDRRDALKREIMQRTQLRVEALTDQAIDLKECAEKAAAVRQLMDQLCTSDDYTLLQKANLTIDQIEGVFVNPPQCTPRAQNDLKCEFSDVPREEIINNLSAFGSVKPIVGVINHLTVKAYHDGFSIQWDAHNYIDNEGTTYYLQQAVGDEEEFRPVYRGSATKYNYKEDLKQGEVYRFRVQVRTTEGVGYWSEPQEAVKAAPDFRWHESWRNVKIDLCRHRLEAGWTKGGSHNFWATFAGDKLFLRGKQYYVEIVILDLGRNKSLKKLAFGVISCRQSKVKSLPWHNGKDPIGQWEVPSWSFQPMLGVINSHNTPSDGVKYCSESMLQTGDRLGMLMDLVDGKLSYFLNGRDLGVAFEGLEEESMLPCVSIRDKIRVLLQFPPPPYGKRKIKLTKLSSMGQTIGF